MNYIKRKIPCDGGFLKTKEALLNFNPTTFIWECANKLVASYVKSLNMDCNQD